MNIDCFFIKQVLLKQSVSYTSDFNRYSQLNRKERIREII